jgi:hypothetical protein
VIDHKITHAGTAVADVTAANQRLKLLQALSIGGRLRQRQARSDIESEAIPLLSDELEVDTSISVQESREVGRVFCPQCAGLPSVLP